MTTYSVTWEIDIDTNGDHREAAQAAALLGFKPHIIEGENDSACTFLVTGPDDLPVTIDLADSLSSLEGDDTE